MLAFTKKKSNRRRDEEIRVSVHYQEQKRNQAVPPTKYSAEPQRMKPPIAIGHN